MGISNSIGSNTFDILLCLGLPWLIKSSFSPTQPGKHYISINSRGLEYSAISLLSTLMLLYIAFASNKFQLNRKVGRACLCMYAVFLILASLIELNVFFMVNLPTCERTVKWSETIISDDIRRKDIRRDYSQSVPKTRSHELYIEEITHSSARAGRLFQKKEKKKKKKPARDLILRVQF